MKRIIVMILGLVLLLSIASPAFAAKRDSVGPTLTNSYPYDYQRNIMMDGELIFRFNEKIQKGRSIALLKIQDADDKFVAFSFELKDNILKLRPKKNLNYASEYRVVIPARGIKDLSGNELEKELVITFYTEGKTGIVDGDTQDQEEAGSSTHTIKINAAMDGSLNEKEEAYLIAVFQSFGILVKDIRVSTMEEATEEKPEDAQEGEEEEVEEVEEEVEYTEFDVYLVDPGPRKIQVIKVIRELTTLGLKEAKDLVDGTSSGPKLVKSGIASEEAEQCVDRIEEQGGTASIVGYGESPY